MPNINPHLEARVRELEGDKKFAERRLASAEQFIKWVESATAGKLPEKFTQDNPTLIGEVFRMHQRLSCAEATMGKLREIQKAQAALPGNCIDHMDNCCADWCLDCSQGREAEPERERLRAEFVAALAASREA